MNTSKIIRAVVGSGKYTTTAPIMKEDYGIYLQIEGVDLPASYEVDFSNSRTGGGSVTMIGDENGVLIPTQFIATGKDVFAFLYHVGADYGKTVYTFCIPNRLRPDRTDETPEPEQQSVIDQAIAALNTAVAQTAQDVIDADESAQSAAESAEGAKRDADFLRDASATATTLPEGSNATVTLSNGQFAFGIPKGNTGDKGDPGETGAIPNLTIGTVQTLEPTQPATATIMGTAENPVLNLGIPQGDKGDTGTPTDAQVGEAVETWLDEHPEATTTVLDGSLTEEKFSAPLVPTFKNDYVTPEMFGAVGDGATDDTQAIQDMFASSAVKFVFGNKTYLVDGAIDVAKACEIHFNDTILLAKQSRAVREFDYVLGFKAVGINTFGKIHVNANQAVNICIFMSGVGGSNFNELSVGSARIWGLYMDKTQNGNNGIIIKRLNAVSCGQMIKAKAERLTNTSLQITEMTGFKFNVLARSFFNNEYSQNQIVVDDSLYTAQNLKNRLVFLNTSTAKPFVQDEQDDFSGVFTLAGASNTVPSDYANNGERDVFIPIGGGIFLNSANSEGVYLIDHISSQSNCLSMYMGLGYGGRINVYESQYDTLLMYNNSLVTSIGYMYLEATGHAFTKHFGNAYDKIYELRDTTNGSTFVHNPFVGQNFVPFMQGNNVVRTRQFNEIGYNDTTLYCPSYAASKKLNGMNIVKQNASLGININEYSPRTITLAAPGYSSTPTVTIDLVDPNAYRGNTFEPITFYVKRSRTDATTYIKFSLSLSNKLIDAGYTLNGAVDNVLTINPVDFNNYMKVTVVLFKDSSTFCVSAEPLTFVDNSTE